MKIKEILSEKWSAKYKRSINCSNPKGFSQKAHCAGRKKNEDVPQPGESSGKAKQFVPGAKIQTKEMTLDVAEAVDPGRRKFLQRTAGAAAMAAAPKQTLGAIGKISQQAANVAKAASTNATLRALGAAAVQAVV